MVCMVTMGVQKMSNKMVLRCNRMFSDDFHVIILEEASRLDEQVFTEVIIPLFGTGTLETHHKTLF